MAWIGLAWFSPVVGPIAYLCLGINRIQRKGAALGIAEARKKVVPNVSTPEEVSRWKAAAAEHESFRGLVKLGNKVTGRNLLVGNKVEPLVDGDEAYPAMLAAIDGATESVNLMSYIFDSDRIGKQFLEALVKARDRGVEVRVLIDHVGSKYSKPTMVKLLREEGLKVASFLPTGKAGLMRFANLRNHRKILVVDGRVGFTGGTNIREDHCLKLKPDFPVRCLHFRFEGPIVMHLQEAFANDWAFADGEVLKGQPWFHPNEHLGPVAARGISEGPDEDLDKLSEMIFGALTAARERVMVVTPYFLPDETVQCALVVAAMRGVKVDVVIPRKNNIRLMDWATVPQLPFLLEKGCRIHRSPEPFDHTKLMVVDGLWSLVGSTNWDPRSLRLNFEYNIECYDETLAGRLEKLVEERIEEAEEVLLEDLNARSIPVRLRDGISQMFSPYL
jgi:cardiolipin synthase